MIIAYLLVHYGYWMMVFIQVMNFVASVGQHDCPLWHTFSKERGSCEYYRHGLIRCEKNMYMLFTVTVSLGTMLHTMLKLVGASIFITPISAKVTTGMVY